MRNVFSKHGFSRRELLRDAIAIGVGAAATSGALSTIARAMDRASDRYFLICTLRGGWDVLASVDPRDPSVFTPERRRDTLIDVPYEKYNDSTRVPFYHAPTDMYLGPYMGRLRDHLDKIALVRGMSMDTLSHGAAVRRFLTGKEAFGEVARGSSIATHIAAELGSENSLPNLCFHAESYNRDRDPWATGIRVTTVSELLRLLSPGAVEFSAVEEEGLNVILGQFAECSDACVSPFRAAAYQGRDDAQALLERNLASKFQFDAATMAMQDIRDHYGFTNAAMTSTLGVEAQMAAAMVALTSKLSRVVSIQLGGVFDTHDLNNWTTQVKGQEQAFNAIASIIEDLETRPYGDGRSWLDHTTILVTSDFSRTPLIGAFGGRDHHLMNACLLIGADIRGGQVIGASSDVGMMPQACDFATGALSATGEIPKPEHILRGMLMSAGISDDIADLRVPPLAAAFASLSGSA